MKTWNYRILKFPNGDGEGLDYFSIHEVYYKDDKPFTYSEKPAGIGSNDISGLCSALEMMQVALQKPILTPQDFPTEKAL